MFTQWYIKQTDQSRLEQDHTDFKVEAGFRGYLVQPIHCTRLFNMKKYFPMWRDTKRIL